MPVVVSSLGSPFHYGGFHYTSQITSATHMGYRSSPVSEHKLCSRGPSFPSRACYSILMAVYQGPGTLIENPLCIFIATILYCNVFRWIPCKSISSPVFHYLQWAFNLSYCFHWTILSFLVHPFCLHTPSWNVILCFTSVLMGTGFCRALCDCAGTAGHSISACTNAPLGL